MRPSVAVLTHALIGSSLGGHACSIPLHRSEKAAVNDVHQIEFATVTCTAPSLDSASAAMACSTARRGSIEASPSGPAVIPSDDISSCSVAPLAPTVANDSAVWADKGDKADVAWPPGLLVTMKCHARPHTEVVALGGPAETSTEGSMWPVREKTFGP